ATTIPLSGCTATAAGAIRSPSKFRVTRPLWPKLRSKDPACGGAAAAAGLAAVPEPASAAVQELAALAAVAPADDNRGLLLLFVVAPALGWVLYNILQPALNQLNK
ncbi:photosystem II protein Y, partial [Escherichia coli]|nr:photosystem II protein Y [Escherichia coli]